MTLKRVRRHLEGVLGLQEGSLDEHKAEIAAAVDEVTRCRIIWPECAPLPLVRFCLPFLLVIYCVACTISAVAAAPRLVLPAAANITPVAPLGTHLARKICLQSVEQLETMWKSLI